MENEACVEESLVQLRPLPHISEPIDTRWKPSNPRLGLFLSFSIKGKGRSHCSAEQRRHIICAQIYESLWMTINSNLIREERQLKQELQEKFNIRRQCFDNAAEVK